MKRIVLMLCLALGGAVVSAAGPDARQIIARAHAASGGENWRAADTLRLSGDAILYRDGRATVADRYEMYRVYPRRLDAAHTTTGRFRLDAFAGDRLLFRISDDGERMYDQNGPMERSAGEELAASSYGFSAVRFALDDGFDVRRMPSDQVEGFPCDFVLITDPSGGTTLAGIDRERGLIRYVGWQTPRGFHNRIYSDFYWLDDPGFMQPGRVRHYYDGNKTADIHWRKARVNVPLADDVFRGE